jgi:hypothetical protein
MYVALHGSLTYPDLPERPRGRTNRNSSTGNIQDKNNCYLLPRNFVNLVSTAGVNSPAFPPTLAASRFKPFDELPEPESCSKTRWGTL